MPRCPRKRYNITNVINTGHIAYQALKPKTKSCVRNRAVTELAAGYRRYVTVGRARQDRDPVGDRHAECGVLSRDDRGRPVAICAAEAGTSHADHDDRDLVRPLTDEEATWEGPSS